MGPNVSVKDPLTGVYSRATLHQRLEEELERSQRTGQSFSLLLIDLDYFKSINDAFGYARGDQVLIELAQRLQSHIRNTDILFRYGGDEFIALLPKTTKENALVLAQRLADIVHAKPFAGEPPVTLSLCIGLASYPLDGHTAQTLFDVADTRNHQAKRSGRSQVISENFAKTVLLPFEETSRLVERDVALRSLQQFFEILPEKSRGVIFIDGAPGSGRSRFLLEVSRMARLQGYAVLTIRGNSALKGRAYGALFEAIQEGKLPQPSPGNEAFAQALAAYIADQGRTGLMITVDDLFNVDWATLDLLYHVLFSSTIAPIGLAYSLQPIDIPRSTPLDAAPLHITIPLESLSVAGMQIWLRSLMQWELPAHFADWLHQQTAGLPSQIQKGLVLLCEREIARKVLSGWALNPDYATFPLREKLALPTQTHLSNLPAGHTTFVGRDREIQAVKDALNTCRLLTVTGPGGVGKTRLTIQVAAEVMEQFANGVYFVPLATIDSPDLLISAIAQALKFAFYGQEEPKTQLLNYLREKRMLLVMDNFEHLVAGAELLTEILATADQVKLLTSSRESLNIPGESTFELKGMELPKDNQSMHPEIFSAIQLFVQMARRVQSDFALLEEDVPNVIRICQLVEGSPLGIELASAWVRVLSCKEIAAETAKSLDFLATNQRGVPERHRSLRAVFESSWNLLADEERAALARIAIFQGSFRREAAAYVTNASLATMSALVYKSLIYKLVSGRFAMHEVLKQFAEAKLAQDPLVKQQVEALHSEYYANLIKHKDKDMLGAKQKTTLVEIDEELDNLRSAWQRTIEALRLGDLAKIIDGLFHFYEIRGLNAEGEELFDQAVKCLQAAIAENHPQTAEIRPLLGMALTRQGAFCQRLARYNQAKSLYEQSQNLIQTDTAPAEHALLLTRRGTLDDLMGNYPEAERLTRAGLEIFQKLGDQRGIARSHNELGVIAYQLGDYVSAKEHAHKSLELYTALNDPWGTGRALTNLGNATAELNELDVSTQHYQAGLKICRDIGDRPGVSVLLNNLGDTARLEGNYAEAKRLTEQSIEVSDEIGDRSGKAIALINLGDIAYRMDDYETAQRRAEQGLAIYREIGSQLGVGYALNVLGRLAVSVGDYTTARQNFQSALQTAQENHAVLLALDSLTGYAALLGQRGQTAPAIELINLVITHPASTKEIYQNATDYLNKIKAGQSVEELNALQPRDFPKELDEVVNEILKKSTS